MTLNAAPLEVARLDLDLSMRDLWVRCFGLGGDLTEIELGDALLGQEQFSAMEYDIVAQALNEEHMDTAGTTRSATPTDPDDREANGLVVAVRHAEPPQMDVSFLML